MSRPLSLLFAVGSVLVAAGAIAQGRPQTIGVSEIRAGMRGYGLTVFRGERPERFDVEVIDVLHNFRPAQDLILIRTHHPTLDHATTVAGMSGSPIYFDNRLAGAYAYGWQFGKDPVAGVTPISNMLAEIARPTRMVPMPVAEPLARRKARPGKVAARRSVGSLGLGAYLGRARVDALAPLRAHTERVGRHSFPRRDSGLVQAATPLMLGGFTGSTADLVSSALEPLGFMTLQAGSSGAARRSARNDRNARTRTPFVDGGAIGVQLVRGDITATAVGTVTHVAGRRLVAFGHPMMDAGEVGLPTATARVLHILASESRSFKIAEALEPLGTLVHDRQSTIVVDAATVPPTVPVTVRIRGAVEAPRDQWRMEVASHRILTPLLTFAAITNAVKATVNDQTDVVFKARSRVAVAGHGVVEVEDLGHMPAGAADPGALARLRLFSLMEAAYGNPFEESRITGVELDLEIRFARDVVEIVDASIASDEVDPGATLNVHVRLRGYDEQEQTRIVSVRIPETAAGETVELILQPGNDVVLDLPEPRNLDDVLRAVHAGLPATSLVLGMKMPSRGLRFRGHVVRSLPSSAIDTLELANDSAGGQLFTTYERQRIDIGRVLRGSASLRVRVRETPRDR